MKVENIPEPPDGTMLVVVTRRVNITRLIWRDDERTARLGRYVKPRWFDDSNDSPFVWAEIVSFAEAIHLVNPDPIATR